MLMNLDLFEPRHNNAQGAPAPAASPTDDSMLDQIRTLDAMGYLGNHDGGGRTVIRPLPEPQSDRRSPAQQPDRQRPCHNRTSAACRTAGSREPAEH